MTVDASIFLIGRRSVPALGGSQSPWKLEAGAAYPVLKTQEEYDAVTYTLSLEKVAASEDLSSIRMIAGDRETSGGSIDVTSGTSVTIEITVPEEGRLVVSSALGRTDQKKKIPRQMKQAERKTTAVTRAAEIPERQKAVTMKEREDQIPRRTETDLTFRRKAVR